MHCAVYVITGNEIRASRDDIGLCSSIETSRKDRIKYQKNALGDSPSPFFYSEAVKEIFDFKLKLKFVKFMF